MGASVLHGENYVPYLLVRERTWPEIMALDPAAEVGRVYLVNDWDTQTFWCSDGTYWRPHNGVCLLHKQDLSDLSTTSLTPADVSGFSSPVFPWSYLLAVPGFILESQLLTVRISPANTQSYLVRVRIGSSSALISTGPNMNVRLKIYGRIWWDGSGFIQSSFAGENPGTAQPGYPLESTPADGPLVLSANTGGDGETISFRTLQMAYSA